MSETDRRHPYSDLPDVAFWRKSVDAGGVRGLESPGGLFDAADRVMSAGSCFASNMVPWLERAGIAYVRTESPHPALQHLPEHLGYRDFSAAYGNMYTVRQFDQLLARAAGEFRPAEDRWHAAGRVIDPFRPGLAYPALDDAEFDALTAQHLACVDRAVREATVLVFTMGLTEAWRSRLDGAVYPVAPGVVAGAFDPARHEFVNFDVADVVDDLRRLRARLDAINPGLRVVLTVSPVPLVATASGDHVLEATTYSKSVLRVAAGVAVREIPSIAYFPAYEIVTGPQARGRSFDADGRTVTPEAIAAVMQVMLGDAARAGEPIASDAEIPDSVRLSALIADAECEEAMLDVD